MAKLEENNNLIRIVIKKNKNLILKLIYNKKNISNQSKKICNWLNANKNRRLFKAKLQI